MKRDKKTPYILKYESANKIIACPQPNDQGLKSKKGFFYLKKNWSKNINIEYYRYNTFPKLNPELFAKPLYHLETLTEYNKLMDHVLF